MRFTSNLKPHILTRIRFSATVCTCEPTEVCCTHSCHRQLLTCKRSQIHVHQMARSELCAGFAEYTAKLWMRRSCSCRVYARAQVSNLPPMLRNTFGGGRGGFACEPPLCYRCGRTLLSDSWEFLERAAESYCKKLVSGSLVSLQFTESYILFFLLNEQTYIAVTDFSFSALFVMTIIDYQASW